MDRGKLHVCWASRAKLMPSLQRSRRRGLQAPQKPCTDSVGSHAEGLVYAYRQSALSGLQMSLGRQRHSRTTSTCDHQWSKRPPCPSAGASRRGRPARCACARRRQCPSPTRPPAPPPACHPPARRQHCTWVTEVNARTCRPPTSRLITRLSRRHLDCQAITNGNDDATGAHICRHLRPTNAIAPQCRSAQRA